MTLNMFEPLKPVSLSALVQCTLSNTYIDSKENQMKAAVKWDISGLLLWKSHFKGFHLDLVNIFCSSGKSHGGNNVCMDHFFPQYNNIHER